MSTYRIAFVGNPNVGKSAWINLLSNADFKVGNWPGVTIEKKEAIVIWNEDTYHLIDLPGVYALGKQQNEERITTTYLQEEVIDCIVHIVDATNLSRNFFLTLQLRELQIPMILILNFMDEVEKYHIEIDVDALSHRLQLPVLAYSAFDYEAKDIVWQEIRDYVHESPCYLPLLYQKDAQIYTDMGLYIHEHLPPHIHLTKKALHQYLYQLMRQDEHACKQYHSWYLDEDKCYRFQTHFHEEHRQKIAVQAVHSLMKYVKQEEGVRYKKTKKIDSFLLHKVLGLPLFFLFFSLLLFFVFRLSAPWNDFIDFFINQMLAKYVAAAVSFLPSSIQGLLLQGILAGVGGVLTFVPLMTILYFMLGILEESGYMARIAVLLDRIMRPFHLSGKSFVSLLLGFGCNVPAIYATRTLDNEKQKKLTALLVPFMSCGARLPVYVLFASAFFPKKTIGAILAIYSIGLLLAFICAYIYTRMHAFQDDEMFVMELPPYRFPSFKVLLQKVKLEVLAYIRKATGIVLWAMVLVWSVSYFPNARVEDSYMAQFAKQVSFLYEPLGFGTRWESIASLPGSIVAKETVVGFFDQVLLHNEEAVYEKLEWKEDIKKVAYAFGSACRDSLQSLFLRPQKEEIDSSLVHAISSLWSDPLASLRAFNFMVYVLLTIPCIMTLQALYKEFGKKICLLSIVTMTIVPYLVCFFIFQFFSFIFIK
ncbi:MAG: ferrous iron transport protein B [Erysipelotrichaceae bacterium]|nr:ferrous iron transport protein B [Erysipelotrichaceae bacterium]